jgi:hypothetical protein
MAPTSPPFEIPVEKMDSCGTAFVYCPGRSTCFTDAVFGSNEAGMWGWSIDYTGTDTIDCEIYLGAGEECDMSGAEKVGDFIIAPNSMEYRLEPGMYEANGFHAYAGKCEVNDAGKQTEGSEFCIASQELLYADRWDTYPLQAEGGPLVNNFVFDGSFAPADGASWPDDYEVFPVGTPGRRFISAHVDVCPMSTPGATPPPTMEPTFPIIEQGTPGPSPAPVNKYQPTTPDLDYGDKMPTNAPTGVIEETGGCQPAWVYCPGRSKCLNDPSFNDGEMAAMNADGGTDGVWGWSIEYDPAEGLVNDCQIIMGATGCDVDSGERVGNFQMREDFAAFCLRDFGYVASTFSYYHGVCPGNDAGEFLETGECNPNEVSNYAYSPEEFPIYSSDGVDKISFTAESTDPMNTPTWPANADIFPMDGKRYLSGYTCVTRRDGGSMSAQSAEAPKEDAINWMWDPSTFPGHGSRRRA